MGPRAGRAERGPPEQQVEEKTWAWAAGRASVVGVTGRGRNSASGASATGLRAQGVGVGLARGSCLQARSPACRCRCRRLVTNGVGRGQAGPGQRRCPRDSSPASSCCRQGPPAQVRGRPGRGVLTSPEGLSWPEGGCPGLRGGLPVLGGC